MLSWFSKPNPYDANLYIDLGTANTLFVTKDKGVILNEPSVIAYKEPKPGQHIPLAAGHEALELAKISAGHVFLRYPLKDGVVADLANTEAMIRLFLQRPAVKKLVKHPKAVISVPFDATEVERRGTLQVGKAAGAKTVILVDEPLVAALGAGVKVESPEGKMLIDMGGGTTEIAIIALNDIIYCESLRTGGHRFVEAVIDHYRQNENLVIDREHAEALKRQYGSALPRKSIQSFEVQGRDYKSGIPRCIQSNSESLSLAFDPLIAQISSGVFRAFEKTPPEIVSDIMEEGITLVGGGSLLTHMIARLSNDTQLPVKTTDKPLLAIAQGGQLLLQRPDLLELIQIEA